MNKHKLLKLLPVFIILIHLALFVSITVLFIESQKIILIFPDKDYHVISYSDVYENGKSVIEKFEKQSNRVMMTYTLKKSNVYPYAGMTFYRDFLFDIRGYDYIMVKIKSTGSKTLRLIIILNIENYTQINKPLTSLFLMKQIPVIENNDKYTFTLKDFTIPTWWYDMNKLADYDSKIKKDFSKTSEIKIETDANQLLNVTDTITIEKILLFKSKKPFILTSISILLFYILFIFLLIFYKKYISKKNKKNVIPYKSLEIENYNDEKIKKLLKYFGENYNDPQLTVKKVSLGCGIPELKIPQILKKNFNLSFPKYISMIRITEAKRLLEETDRQVIEIALSLGYNNITHFNKIFKSIENISPTEYRKKIIKNK